jgi:Uma2 family endonuclease
MVTEPLWELEEYAKTGISEYWLINPPMETISVFVLSEGADIYVKAGIYSKGQVAKSVKLESFSDEVNQVSSL